MLNDLEQEFQKAKAFVLTSLSRLLKRAQKRIAERQQILEECRNWHKVDHEATLLKANLYLARKGMESLSVSDWEDHDKQRVLNLDPLLEPHEQLRRLFKKSKKLRMGEVHAIRQLEIATNDAEAKETLFNEVEKIPSMEQLLLFCEKNALRWKKSQIIPKVKKETISKPYHSFTSKTGMDIWVGKSAKNNDLLTFHHAKGSDWWMHARDFTGSHVVLRCLKDKNPDEESLKDAAELALRYSKGKDCGEGEVVVTQVKGVRRVKGSPGKVTLSKHKVMKVILDNKRFNRMRENGK